MEGAEKRYSVSLVYTRNQYEVTEIDLRVLIVYAKNKEEALGKTIIHYEEISKNYKLSNRVIIELKK